MPLVFAVILLPILVSALARVQGSLERFFLVLPLAMMAGLAGVWFAISSWSFSPEDAMLTAVLILAAAGLAALAAVGLDHFDGRWERRLQNRRFAAAICRRLPGQREAAVFSGLPTRRARGQAGGGLLLGQGPMACQQLRAPDRRALGSGGQGGCPPTPRC